MAACCDAVCVFVNDNINRKVIEKLEIYGVKIIALRCAGYNNVDLKFARGRITVVRVPAYSPYAVAEHTMGMILMLNRKLHRAYIRTRDHNFSLDALTGFDLNGKTVGIIGTGRIGKAFLDLCNGFNMNILAYDKICTYTDFARYVDLDEIFAKSDIISLHCPLNEETYHLIDESAINKMKKGVILINTSRGALIDAEALLEGIKSRKIGGACLDVYEEESDFFFEDFSGHILEDDTLARLISMPNVIVTSHQAFLTEEALENIAETTVENLVTLAKTGQCPNELCYRCGNIEHCRKERKERCF
jgi:D-lactate dehydrogenase